MHILLLGNGFDLAHGLPTRYIDFLNFISKLIIILNHDDFESKEIEISIDTMCGSVSQKMHINHSEWSTLILHNTWINYFLKNKTDMKQNWIDFEVEISKVIQVVDEARKQRIENEGLELSTTKSILLKDIISCQFEEEKSIWNVFSSLYLVDDFITQLEIDLNKLIRALELYLVEFVEKIDCSLVSPDIKEVMVRLNKEKCLADLSKIISFNYTHTFEQLYGFRGNFTYDFIHGEALNVSTLEDNNMVLGIDEYLRGERRDKEITFIAFKKFYQRIHKQTGCAYKSWVDIVRKDSQKKKSWILDGENHSKDYLHNLYIFGHSLDVTDGDVLRDLILNDNMVTTIYYKDKEQRGRQIANLVKVIGQDELIKRTGGSTKTIEFKLQQEMIVN